MREVDRIAQLLHQSLNGPAYHGPSILEALKGVSAEVARRVPAGGGHSIWQVVGHVAAELRYAGDLLGGRAAPWIEGETTWPAVEDTSAAAWDQVKNELAEANRALVDIVEQLEDAILATELTSVRRTYYVMLHGLVQHNAYHAGQISLLRRQRNDGAGQPATRPGPTDTQGRDGLESQFGIRAFQTEDEPAVIGLWDRCGLLRPWNHPHEDIARKLLVRPDLFLVGVSDGRIVATVMAGYDGHRGWIYSLAVEPEAQRRGVGRTMMQEAERRLRAAGCPKVNLQIRGENAGVVAFYRSLGYVEEDRVSMGRRLDEEA